MREAVNKSATRPVEGPGTDVKQQNATQPVEAKNIPDPMSCRDAHHVLSVTIPTCHGFHN